MSDLTNYPRQDKYETTLSQDLDNSSTSVYLTTPPSFSLASGQSCEMIIDYNSSTKYERCTIAGPYTGGTSPLTVTRGGPRYSGGASTATTHSGGAKVIIGPTYADLENAATAINTKMDKTGGTFTGSIDFSGASTTVRLPNLTTVQRDALTPALGMKIYNTSLGTEQVYKAGSWQNNDTGTSVPNGADHAAGILDVANGTEIGAGTAIDATSGAINVIPVSQTVKTSSGAGDENKIGVLDSSGKYATGFIPSGTDASKVALSTYSAKGSILAATAASTPADLPVGTNNQVLIADSAQASGVKWGQAPLVAGNTNNGKTTRANNAASGTQTIAHGLSATPVSVDIQAITINTAPISSQSVGGWKSGTQNCIGYVSNISTATVYTINDTTTIYLESSAGNHQKATVTVDATNITLTWVKTGTGAGAGANMEILWKAYC